jgi:hypothetical protein
MESCKQRTLLRSVSQKRRIRPSVLAQGAFLIGPISFDPAFAARFEGFDEVLVAVIAGYRRERGNQAEKIVVRTQPAAIIRRCFVHLAIQPRLLISHQTRLEGIT